ncbi:MAG: TonB-dependent receptor [Candidatus Latescibacterota bacterium]
MRPDLGLTFGLRYDWYSTIGSSLTPRAALVYHLGSSSTLKALYGQAFRAPNVYELFYGDPGDGSTQKPNPALEAETARTLELVWEQELGRHAWGRVSLYRYDVQGLIEQALDPADGLLQFRNAGSVRALGAEVEVQGRLPGEARPHASYAYQGPRDGSDEPLSNAPAHVLAAGLSRPLAGWLTATATWRWESGRRTLQRDARGRVVRTDPYLVGSAYLACRPAWGPLAPNRLTLTLGVQNLADAHYRAPGGAEHLQPSIAQPGRRWTLQAHYAH